MRNNRNTVGDQFKPSTQRNLINSVDRKTMTNPQTQQTQSRQANQIQLNQKMASTINNALLRLPNQGNRSSISNSLQPKASTLISTISAFMNSIDRNFQKSNLDVESIPQLLTFWGYPHSYNKSVFQPIGAPHTWPNCLQMMQFLAEITTYFFEYKLQFDEYKLDIEQIDLVLQAFSKQDCTQYQNYLNKIKSSLIKQQQQLLFKIQSSQLTLRNIKNSQRSLVQMQTQQSILLQKLQRESQHVIQIDQQNNSIRNEIQKIDDNYEQLEITKQSLLKKIKLLEQEISNQQLSLQQATKIELDIKQYHLRIKDNNNQLESKKKQYQSQKVKIVDKFYKIVDDVNQIRNSSRKYQGQLEKRGLEIAIPQTDHVAFTQAIHTEDINAFNQAVLKMIEADKIKAMLIGQQSLADVLEHQTKLLNNQLAQAQLNKNQVQNQNRQVSTQVQKLEKHRQQTQKQIQSLINKRNNILQTTDQIKHSTNSIKLHNEQLLRKQIQLTQQTKQRKQNMMEGIKLLKKYQNDCQGLIKIMEQKQIETKKKVQEILERIQGGFQYLNKQLENLW